MVIGTLSHAKIILELFLHNDKDKAFSEGGDLSLNPSPPEGETPLTSPLTFIKNEGEELIRKENELYLKLGWLTLNSEPNSKFNLIR